MDILSGEDTFLIYLMRRLLKKKVAPSLTLGQYRGADKSLARPTSRCILFDGENISFDASLVIYIYIHIYSYNIPPIMTINRVYEH